MSGVVTIAKSKKLDETGLSNDTRSIYLERTGGELDFPGYDTDWDQNYDPDVEGDKIDDSGLTHTIEIPEHLRRFLNG